MTTQRLKAFANEVGWARGRDRAVACVMALAVLASPVGVRAFGTSNAWAQAKKPAVKAPAKSGAKPAKKSEKAASASGPSTSSPATSPSPFFIPKSPASAMDPLSSAPSSAPASPSPASPSASPAAASSGGEAMAGDLRRARESYTSGEAKFRTGDFAGALADFTVAESVKPAPQTTRYVAICLDRLGRVQEAVAMYEKFLANVPAKLEVEAFEIRNRVQVLRDTPALVKVEANAGVAELFVDGQDAAMAVPAAVTLAPGHHSLRVVAAGYAEQTKEVDLTFGAKETVRFEFTSSGEAQAAAPSSASPSASAASKSKWPAYLTGSLALAAAGTGAYFGIAALDSKTKFDRAPTEKLADDGQNQALIADMAFGVALTLGVTSVVLFLSDGESSTGKASASLKAPSKSASSPSAAVLPMMVPGGAGAGAVVRF